MLMRSGERGSRQPQNFFTGSEDVLLADCADYLDRRLAGELSDPRPKRLR